MKLENFQEVGFVPRMRASSLEPSGEKMYEKIKQTKAKVQFHLRAKRNKIVNRSLRAVVLGRRSRSRSVSSRPSIATSSGLRFRRDSYSNSSSPSPSNTADDPIIIDGDDDFEEIVEDEQEEEEEEEQRKDEETPQQSDGCDIVMGPPLLVNKASKARSYVEEG